MLPLRPRVDLGAMAIKGYSAFPKASILLKPHHQIVLCHKQDTLLQGILAHCREAVGVFYSLTRLGKCQFDTENYLTRWQLQIHWEVEDDYEVFGEDYFQYLHHHHHVVPLARISLTLSRHFSLSFIASGRSSGLHPVSSHSY